MRRLIPILIFAASILFPARLSFAQSSMPSSSCPCTLRGSVVDSVSGQPVPHALVKLTAPSPQAALTDSEGKFQFEGLPAGSATLEATKPGFFGNSGSVPLSSSVFSTELGPSKEPATLKLIPEGVISGEISDENGQPREGFTISVFLRGAGHRGPGLGSDMLHRPAVTDDQGRFRVAGLQSGSYYLLAHQPQAPALNATGKSFSPSGYPTMFYPAASDIASATPVKVPPGGTVQANISLKRVAFIRLSGTVSGYNPDGNIVVMLQDISGTPENLDISFDRSTGVFHTKWIPSGTYTLIARSAGAISADAYGIVFFASQVVKAASDVAGIHLALQRTLDVPLFVHDLPTGGNQNIQSVPPALALIPQNSADTFITFAPRTISLTSESEGDFHATFSGVGPGAYKLQIEPRYNSPYYIESATWGSTDLLRDDLVLDSSSSIPPIEIRVRDDGAALNGKVFSGGTPLPALVVLLSDKHMRPITLPVSTGGIFNLTGLAPGGYRIFAVDASASSDYEDSAFLAKISSKIQEITLTPKQSASINLELATVEE